MFLLKINKEKGEVWLVRNKRKGITLIAKIKSEGQYCDGCFFKYKENICLEFYRYMRGIPNSISGHPCFCSLCKKKLGIIEAGVMLVKKWK